MDSNEDPFEYALAFEDEKARALCSICRSGIYFNLSAEMRFRIPEDVEVFREEWKNHFFNLKQLVIIKVKKTKKSSPR